MEREEAPGLYNSNQRYALAVTVPSAPPNGQTYHVVLVGMGLEEKEAWAGKEGEGWEGKGA